MPVLEMMVSFLLEEQVFWSSLCNALLMAFRNSAAITVGGCKGSHRLGCLYMARSMDSQKFSFCTLESFGTSISNTSNSNCRPQDRLDRPMGDLLSLRFFN